jgi:DNA replicative helicase MCM subunit Mcm2 (Cdc46/Mcm family)
VLRVQRRDGNTLSSVLRSAWDWEILSIMTKTAPAKATGAHVSIIGHITQDELRRELRATDEANGYANRFLFVYAERSRYLPFGGQLDEEEMTELSDALNFARYQARKVDKVVFSKKARKRWKKLYIRLTKETPGMLGAITSRAEAQVLRLSLVYALLDSSSEIKTQHLKAANALWTYCEKSAAFVFGGTLGDPVADTILRGLRSNKKGLTRDDIRELFNHNREKDEIDEALALLANSSLAVCHREPTGGRAAERWTAV